MKSKEIKTNINVNTKQLLTPSFTSFKTNESDKEKSKIIKLIGMYTKQKEKSIYKTLSDVFLKTTYGISYKDIKFNEEQKNYEYISKDGKAIKFDLLSKYAQEEKNVKELTSNKRYNKCHNMALSLATNFENATVLTGYIVHQGYKILHSVVEISKDNKKQICDWTNNLIMEKEKYINLFQFKILSEIKGKDILSDLSKIKETPLSITNKEYVVFRDEFMRDLAKNDFLFETTNNSRKK